MTDVSLQAARSDGATARRADHRLSFYEADPHLCQLVGTYLADGLRLGEGVVALATREHWRRVRERIDAEGGALERAEQDGRVAFLDAEATLAHLLDGDAVRADLFHDTVAAAIDRVSAAAPRSRARVFGELVNLLWCSGRVEVALELERLWEEALERRDATLLCAYRSDVVPCDEHLAGLERVCRAHAVVTPPESHADIPAGDGRELVVAVLRRRASTLLREIEERKDIEARLRAREKELAEQATRRDEFIALLGHELRNPLGAIAAALGVMGAGEPKSTARARAVVARQVTKMARIVDDLLDMARLDHGKVALRFETLDLRAIVAQVIDVAQPALEGRRQTLAVDLPAAPVWCEGDSVRLEQIVGNLVHNASKYTPQGGHVALALAIDGDRAVITVRDDGKGMSAELVGRLFQPFVQAEPGAEGGLGLGLALVRRLVTLHGGTIEGTSEGAGRGSTFTLRLPLGPAL